MPLLERYAWLSVVTAAVTIALKLGAWKITGSVGLFSDAAESLVNLVAALIALVALRVSARPADDDHNYGHAKAEYFSAGAEGAMIFVAAVAIIVSAVERLVHPRDVESFGIGIAISVVAAVLNGVVGMRLLRAGAAHRSPTLSADGKHLLTDVATSVGVVAAIVLVWVTGWMVLDPLIALAVAVNIVVVGGKLVWESAKALMDVALPDDDVAVIERVLAAHREADVVDFHELRTRESGRHRFVEFHALVPGEWTVERAHDLVEEVECAIREGLEDAHIVAHIEPIEDERAYGDVHL